jgi:ABC-type phosphate transport system substrate-binding protein
MSALRTTGLLVGALLLVALGAAVGFLASLSAVSFAMSRRANQTSFSADGSASIKPASAGRSARFRERWLGSRQPN